LSRNQLIILGSALAVIVLAAILYFTVFQGSSDNGTGLSGTQQRAGVTVLSDDRTLGSPKAPVVVLEYAAPSCPHCAHFDMDIFPILKKQYIDTGKVFYIFRVFPISAVDGAAESMARCLPADNYFPFIDLLFRNQKQWDPEFGITDVHAGLIQMGRIAGMSADQVDACIKDEAKADRTNKVAQDGTTKYNIQGTPTFIIDGLVQPSGVVPWPTMQNIINSELSKK
jgi:protein-disulfide isomerase